MDLIYLDSTEADILWWRWPKSLAIDPKDAGGMDKDRAEWRAKIYVFLLFLATHGLLCSPQNKVFSPSQMMRWSKCQE